MGSRIGFHLGREGTRFPTGKRYRVPEHSRWVDLPRKSAFVDRIPVKDLERGLEQVVREATSQSPPQIKVNWINP